MSRALEGEEAGARVTEHIVSLRSARSDRKSRRTVHLGKAPLERLKLLGREHRAGEQVVFDRKPLAVSSVTNIVERERRETLLGQSHRPEELGRVAELLVAAVLGPAELLGHDVDDLRERLERGFGVEERETRPAGDDVHSCRGVLAAAGPGDFGVDVGVGRVEAVAVRREAEAGRRCHCGRKRQVSSKIERAQAGPFANALAQTPHERSP